MFVQWAAFDRALSGLAWPNPEARVLVACSGGLDSVVLLDLAVTRLGPGRVVVGHVNHRARPGSDGDEAFVAELARERCAEWLARRLEPPRTDEATLRRLRYAALEDLRTEARAAFVLLGHHRDDQAETVLIRILRRGRVEGMAAVRGRFVRPLLTVPRRHLEAHARRRRLRWRDDPTNPEPAFLRNRVRRELLPLLESRYRGGIRRRLAALASAAVVPSVETRPRRGAGAPLAGDGAPTVEPPRLEWRQVMHEGQHPPRQPDTVWFDADRVPALSVRNLRPGDRIRPWGMAGRKKVVDVFQEHRVPRALRGRMPLVVAGDEVLWVPGLVRSAVGAIQPETRRRWELWCKWE